MKKEDILKPYLFVPALIFLFMLSSCGPRIKPAETVQISDPSFEKGQDEYLKGKYRNAERFFREYLVKIQDPLRTVSAEYWLGMSLMKQEKYAQALELFSEINKRHASSRLWNLIQKAKADTYFCMKNYSEAVSRYERLERKTADNVNRAEIVYKKGICQIRTRDFYLGKRTLARVLSDYPKTFFAKRAAETLEECEGYFFVQVGAFTKRDSAEEVMRKASDKGYTAYVRVMSVGDCKMYSVRVGRLNDYNAALSFAARLRKAGFNTVVKP